MNWLKEVESASDKVISPLQDLEDSLHPIVNYFIVPLFAFANAGIFLLGTGPASVFEGISLAIVCGLVIGKFAGIFVFSWLTVKFKLAPMPAHASWTMMASIAMLGGIGFTVSLFIATLSFGGAGVHGRPAQSCQARHRRRLTPLGHNRLPAPPQNPSQSLRPRPRRRRLGFRYISKGSRTATMGFYCRYRFPGHQLLRNCWVDLLFGQNLCFFLRPQINIFCQGGNRLLLH